MDHLVCCGDKAWHKYLGGPLVTIHLHPLFPCVADYVRKHGSLICPVCNTAWKDVPILTAQKNHATGYCEGSSANMEASSAPSVSPIMYALVLKVKAPLVIVTGTMDANKLVDYVYRRTKKQANIVPQREPEPEKKEEPKEAEKTVEEAKAEEKKEENIEKKEEEKPTVEKPKKEEEGEKEVGEDKSENKEEKRGVI